MVRVALPVLFAFVAAATAQRLCGSTPTHEEVSAMEADFAVQKVKAASTFADVGIQATPVIPVGLIVTL